MDSYSTRTATVPYAFLSFGYSISTECDIIIKHSVEECPSAFKPGFKSHLAHDTLFIFLTIPGTLSASQNLVSLFQNQKKFK